MLTDVGGVSGETTTYVHDKNGNVTSIKDGNSNLTAQVFDQLNRLKSKTNANSSVMSYTYDPHDGLLSMSDFDGNSTTWVRDGFEDATAQQSPDSGVTTYKYDSDGNMTQWTPAAGFSGNMSYDALDRITGKVFSSQPTQNIFYAYDQTGPYPYSANEIGRLSYIDDAAGVMYFAYDGFGNVNHRERTNSSYTDLNDVWATYDAANRPSGIAYPSGIYVGWGRDAAGEINQVTLFPPGGAPSKVVEWPAYGPFYGPVRYESFGNGVQDGMVLDQDYRRTASQIFTSSGNLSNQTNTFDNASNLTTISDSTVAANSQTLGYDVLNRLTSAVSGTGGYGTLAFGYDSNGNLTSRTAGGTSYTYSYTSGTNRLAGVTWPSNSETIGYTADGDINSMTLNGTAAFTGTYTILDRLSAVSNTPTAISSMVYDAYGLRFSKTDSGGSADTYVYDLQGNLIEENTGGTVKDYIYINGRLDGIWLPASSTLYYVAQDIRGAPFFITDASQNVVWNTQYQPYGPTTPTGTLAQNIRLPGQYYDSETTLNYNGMRDYVPTWGRYLEADPIGLNGGPNPYKYSSANPLKYIDRFGLQEADEDDDSEADNEAQQIRKEVENIGADDLERERQADERQEEESTLTPPPSLTQCRIHWGRQDKHIPGTNNYRPGRSVLTYSDPQQLVDDFAGTGESANGIPAGQPGARERVDFGQVIGNYVDLAGNSTPTTVGMIVYSGSGVHIYPARPVQ